MNLQVRATPVQNIKKKPLEKAIEKCVRTAIVKYDGRNDKKQSLDRKIK